MKQMQSVIPQPVPTARAAVQAAVFAAMGLSSSAILVLAGFYLSTLFLN